MSTAVHVEVTTPLATVELDRPEEQDVLTPHGWEELAVAFERLSTREDLGCVVLCGTGSRAVSEASDVPASRWKRATLADGRAYSHAIARALRAIRCCPHPTVALIDGICFGGGLGIAACCDLRVCGESSRFGVGTDGVRLTTSREELEPLEQLLGASPLLDLMRGGGLIGADRALTHGLVNRVHADEALVAQGYGLAARIAAGAPLVNRWHKKLIRRLHERPRLSAAEGAESQQA